MDPKPTPREFWTAVTAIFGQKMAGAFWFFWASTVLLVGDLLSLFFVQSIVSQIVAVFATIGYVIAFAISIYSIWSDERIKVVDLQERIEPKLEIYFDPKDKRCVQHYPINRESTEIFDWVRVLPRCSGKSELVHNCRGFLRGVSKIEENGEETRFDFDDSYQVIWSPEDDFSPRQISPEKNTYLNILQIFPKPPYIRPQLWEAKNQNRSIPFWLMNAFQKPGKYKFNFVIQGDNCPPACISVKIVLADDYKDNEISQC